MTGSLDMPPVPRLVRYVAWLVLAVGVVMAFAGAWRVGVTFDEPIHVQRLNEYLQSGWYLTPGQLEHGEPAKDMTQQFVYAPVAMLLLHGLGILTGVEPASAASFTEEAYVVRHLGTALLGVVGLVAVALTARVLTRRWDWALLAAAALAAVPLWTGHSMFNLKDTPVGTGYALVTLAFCLALLPLGARWWHRLAVPLTMAAGVMLSIGTRPGMWTGLTVSGLWFVVAVMLARDPERPIARLRALVEVAAGVALGLVGVVLAYPAVFINPAEALTNSLSASANFVGGSSNRGFLPFAVLLQMPLVLLGLSLIGTAITAKRLFQQRGRSVQTACWTLVGVQLFAMPVAGVLKGANLYGDLRQVMFATPAMALMAVLGASWLLPWRGSRRYPVHRHVSVALLAAGLVAPTVIQASLFPLNYIYWNPLSMALSGSNNGGDYYRASSRELAAVLPREGRLVCSPVPDEDDRATRWSTLYGWRDCRAGEESPLGMYPAADSSSVDLAPDEIWVAWFGNLDDRPRDGCSEHRSIEVHPIGPEIRTAALYRCRIPFPVLREREVGFGFADREGNAMVDEGFQSPYTDGDEHGVRMMEEVGKLTFRLDNAFAGSPVTLTMKVASSSQALVTFAGVRLVTTHHRDTMRVEIPAPLVRGAIARAQSLEFRSPEGTEPFFKIYSLAATAQS